MISNHDLSGRSFSTRDNDNDLWGKSCAVSYLGAWWYRACGLSNLNGMYHGSLHQAVGWYRWMNAWVPLTFSEMKMRRNT